MTKSKDSVMMPVEKVWFLKRLTLGEFSEWKLFIFLPQIPFFMLGFLTVLVYTLLALINKSLDKLGKLIWQNIVGWTINILAIFFISIFLLGIWISFSRRVLSSHKTVKMLGRIRYTLKNKYLFYFIYPFSIFWIFVEILKSPVDVYFYCGYYNLFKIRYEIGIALGVLFFLIILQMIFSPPFLTLGDFFNSGNNLISEISNVISSYEVLCKNNELFSTIWNNTLEFFDMVDRFLYSRINVGINNVSELSANIMMVAASNKKQVLEYITNRISRIMKNIKKKNYVNIINIIYEIDNKARHNVQKFEKAIYFKPQEYQEVKKSNYIINIFKGVYGILGFIFVVLQIIDIVSNMV